MTEEERIEHESEYEELLALFIALLKSWDKEDKEEALFELAQLRTQQAFKHVVKGLGIDLDNAETLLKNLGDENLTQRDKDMRDRLSAAINNLIDFCVCEEYQAYEEIKDLIESGEEIDFDDLDVFLVINNKYNNYRSMVENADIEYAGVMAAFWISLSSRDYLVYWTQNDAKVRPWHMELQGYAAPRDEFPSWMIPPIEYNCRCFLEVLDYRSAIGQLTNVKNILEVRKPDNLNEVYSESLAKCGRIFGPSHDYFQVKEEDREMLNGFVARLKKEYYG